MKSSKSSKNKRSATATGPVVRQPTCEDIAALAYSIWEREGCPDGRAREHWLKAELEIRERGLAPAPPPPAKF